MSTHPMDLSQRGEHQVVDLSSPPPSDTEEGDLVIDDQPQQAPVLANTGSTVTAAAAAVPALGKILSPLDHLKQQVFGSGWEIRSPMGGTGIITKMVDDSSGYGSGSSRSGTETETGQADGQPPLKLRIVRADSPHPRKMRILANQSAAAGRSEPVRPSPIMATAAAPRYSVPPPMVTAPMPMSASATGYMYSGQQPLFSVRPPTTAHPMASNQDFAVRFPAEAAAVVAAMKARAAAEAAAATPSASTSTNEPQQRVYGGTPAPTRVDFLPPSRKRKTYRKQHFVYNTVEPAEIRKEKERLYADAKNALKFALKEIAGTLPEFCVKRRQQFFDYSKQLEENLDILVFQTLHVPSVITQPE